MSNLGTIFKCNVVGTETLLYSFIGGATDGASPDQGMVQGSDGNLYGISTSGGILNDGAIFKCSTSGAESLFYTLGEGIGYYLSGSLIQAQDGYIYGMTQSGGPLNQGTIFKYSTSGTLSVLHNFIGGTTDGASPCGSLIQASDGNFYGMTNTGGTSNKGTIFKCTTSGTITLLHSFAGGVSDGLTMYGSLIQGTDGNFYGMTNAGGTSNKGIIFMCTPSGAFTLLYSFMGGASDGANPYGSLIQGIDGNLYGMTLNGGSSNYGVVFKCTISGTEVVIHNFAGGISDGEYPYGNLIQTNDSTIYGAASGGGTSNLGGIFKCTISGAQPTIESFNFSFFGSLMQASDSNFYLFKPISASNGFLYGYTRSGTQIASKNLSWPISFPPGGSAYGSSLLEYMTTGIKKAVDCISYTYILTDTIVGGGLGCTHHWSTGATTAVINNISASGGTYSDTVTNAKGLKVIATITLSALPAYIPITITMGSNQTICSGNSTNLSAIGNGGFGSFIYNWLPGSLSGSSPSINPVATQVYTVTATDALGCSSKDSMTVNVNQPNTGDTAVISCNSFKWYGNTYTSSSTHTHGFTNVAGCDSTVTLHLTINYGTTGDTTSIVCDSLRWHGTKYTTSGMPTNTLTNSKGCDSIVTLHLTINHSTTGDTNATACDSLKWYGNKYTVSGTPTHTLTTAKGCDSVVTLHLTINHSTTGDTSATACDSLKWYGTKYTTSGTPMHTLTTSKGCDSVVTLHLTINHSATGDTNATTCDSLRWFGTEYTTSGTPTHSLITAKGCDSVVTLHLTVNTCTGIDEISESNYINIYPNPTKDIINIEMSQPMDGTISITNVLGQQVYSGKISNNTTTKQISIGTLPQGIYLLKIESEEQTIVKRIIKL